MSLSPALTKPKRREQSRFYGGVLVSTGMVKQDQRAAAPDRHKTGNYKSNNNDNYVAAAA